MRIQVACQRGCQSLRRVLSSVAGIALQQKCAMRQQLVEQVSLVRVVNVLRGKFFQSSAHSRSFSLSHDTFFSSPQFNRAFSRPGNRELVKQFFVCVDEPLFHFASAMYLIVLGVRPSVSAIAFGFTPFSLSNTIHAFCFSERGTGFLFFPPCPSFRIWAPNPLQPDCALAR